MTYDSFDRILRSIKMPSGKLLADGTTYRITKRYFKNVIVPDKLKEELNFFDKFLVLTSDGETVVGGVLFYGSVDIQIEIFPEYRGMHYMSKIFKNGVLKSECYPKQRVTLEVSELYSINDYKMKEYLLKCARLCVGNKNDIYNHFSCMLWVDETSLHDKKSDIKKFLEENFDKEERI